MKKYTLPKEFGEKWVRALRSGEYKQGRERLAIKRNRKKYSYCCLGVAGKLCDIPDEGLLDSGELSELEVWDDNEYNSTPVYDIYPSLPREIVLGELKKDLINLNDYEKYTFPEIADWIEQNCQFV